MGGRFRLGFSSITATSDIKQITSLHERVIDSEIFYLLAMFEIGVRSAGLKWRISFSDISSMLS